MICSSTAVDSSLLCAVDLSSGVFVGSNEVKGAPCQHADDGIEIRSINVSADPRRLERDRAGAAKGICDFRPMAEARDAEFLHQLGQ